MQRAGTAGDVALRPGRVHLARDDRDPQPRRSDRSDTDAPERDERAAPGGPTRRPGPTPLAFRPPCWMDRALDAAIFAAKAATIACAIDGFVNADTPRLRGKAIRTRAIGYTGALFLVPVIWRVLPDRGRYPRGLDLAVTLPLLIDAGGNALGLYEEAHLDDVVHFLNAAIVSGVAGALFGTRTDEPWQAALAGTGTAIAGETRLGDRRVRRDEGRRRRDGPDLRGHDGRPRRIDARGGRRRDRDLAPDAARAKAERRRGWRHAVAGLATAGEPIAIVGGRGLGRRAGRRRGALTPTR